VGLARAAGFHRAGIVDPRLLEAQRPRGVPAPPVAGNRAVSPGNGDSRAEDLEWDWITRPSRWSASCTILVCCLSCLRAEPDDESSPGDPHGLVAPFARAHYYRQAVKMLDGVARRLEQDTGLPRASVRLFSNSRIPEKPLLVATGLAAYGKNGCAIVPGLGSMFVIAGGVLPVATRLSAPAAPLPDPCGPCRSCQAACPVRALEEPYVVRRDLCLQSLASSAEEMDDQAMGRWGVRLYGCQDCQAVCPHNRGLRVTARPAGGEIGPSIPLRAFLSGSEEARAQRLRGTALGLSWVAPAALLRNSLVAAGNRGDASIRAEVERYLGGENPALVRRAARWARERL
jgi:epoxyqueuosine reductase